MTRIPEELARVIATLTEIARRRSPRFIGERIRSARMNLGLSQEQLADALEIPRPAISQIESGKRAVDSMELVALSRMLQKPLSFFLDPPIDETIDEPVRILYRSNDITDDDKPVVDDFLALVKDYAMLEEQLGFSVTQALPSWGTDIRSRWDAVVDGQKSAAALRGYLNLGLAPAKEIENILDAIGVKVVKRALPKSAVWGFSVTSRQWGNCIFVNANCTLERQTFTLAHELGHLTMDRDHSATVLTDKQSPDRADDMRALIEVRANAFAAAFLMPDMAAKNLLATLGIESGEQVSALTINYLRTTFGVSFDAMLWRLVNLKVLTKEDRLRFQSYIRDEEKHAPSLFGDNLPERYRNLAFKAYQNATISIGKLAELLRTDIYEARKKVKEFRIQQVPV